MKKILLLILPALMLVSCAEIIKESARKQLSATAEITDIELKGSTIDIGIVCDGCEFKNDEFIYYYTFNEDIIPYEALKENEMMLREEFKRDLQMEAIAGDEFYSLLKDVDGKITYHYTGKNTGRTFIITLKMPN